LLTLRLIKVRSLYQILFLVLSEQLDSNGQQKGHRDKQYVE
jgi:hypothetical protein